MIAAVLSILAPLWRPIAAALAGLIAYAKGRSDASRARDLTEATETADAHTRVSTEAAGRDRSPDAVDQRLREAGLL